MSGEGNTVVGGLVGASASGGSTYTDDYWDTTTSGTTSSAGGTDMTTVQLHAGLPAGFSPSLWAEKPAVINGLPYLIDLPR